MVLNRNIPVFFFLAGIFILVLGFSIPGFSQAQLKVQNQQGFDKQPIHFGFTLGVNSTSFVIKPVKDLHALDTVLNIESSSGTGFNLGIISNLRMGEHFDLRFIPALSFAQRDVVYSFKSSVSVDASTVTKSVESTFVEFPLDLKFKSSRINNYRMYVLGGFKYSLDLASRKNDKQQKDQEPLKIEKVDYGYTFGFGMDFYLVYVKVTPEIKMYNGLNNLVVKDEFVYSKVIDKLYSKIFLFSITFE